MGGIIHKQVKVGHGKWDKQSPKGSNARAKVVPAPYDCLRHGVNLENCRHREPNAIDKDDVGTSVLS